jgi:hypothetical protein
VYFEYRGDTSKGNSENKDIVFFRLIKIQSGSDILFDKILLKLSFEIEDNESIKLTLYLTIKEE